jgi:hypothetical protein
VVIASIEQRHPDRNVAKRARRIQPAKSAPHDCDVHGLTILDRLQGSARRRGTVIAAAARMSMTQRMTSWGGARLSRRLSRSLPVLGAAIAVATVFTTMRRKGVISGALDTGLNAVPLVGAAKNTIEVLRGRDFFPDRVRKI